MRESSHLATLADMLGVGILCIDDNARLFYANELACRLLRAESVLELADRWPGLDEEISRNLSAATDRTVLDLGNPGRRLRLEVRPCSVDGPAGRVLLLKDVAAVGAGDRSVMLAARMRLQRHLAGAWVHDLNGPLNNVNLTLELLTAKLASGGPELREKCERHLTVLKQETRRAAALLRLVQERDRSSERAQSVDLRAEMETALRVCKREAGTRRARISLDCTAKPVLVTGCRAELSLAVLSLMHVSLACASEGAKLDCALAVAGSKATLRYDVRPGTLEERCVVASQTVLPVHGADAAGYLYAARVALEANGGAIEVICGRASDCAIVATLPLQQRTSVAKAASPTSEI